MLDVVVLSYPESLEPDTGDRTVTDASVVTETILRRPVVETVYEKVVLRRVHGSVCLLFLSATLLARPNPVEETGNPRTVEQDRYETTFLLTRRPSHEVSQGVTRVVMKTVSVATKNIRTVVILIKYDLLDIPLTFRMVSRTTGRSETLSPSLSFETGGVPVKSFDVVNA